MTRFRTGRARAGWYLPAKWSTEVARASLVLVSAGVFAPNGSRLRGLVVELVGRSRRNTNTQQIQDWTLGPGETGCFAFTIGQANTIGRYDLRTSFEADPTTRAEGAIAARGDLGPEYTRLASWWSRA